MSTKEGLRIAIQKTIEQGRRSVDEGGACLYRGVNGAKCAVGHLIPESRYCESINRDTLRSILNKAVIPSKYLTHRKHESYLFLVQICHDEAESEDFIDEFCKNIKEQIYMYSLPKYCLDFLPEKYRGES